MVIYTVYRLQVENGKKITEANLEKKGRLGVMRNIFCRPQDVSSERAKFECEFKLGWGRINGFSPPSNF